jgi:hypothetical protein
MGLFQKSQVFLVIPGAIFKIFFGVVYLALSYINCITPDIKILEKELEIYCIKGPDKNRTDIRTSVTTEVTHETNAVVLPRIA